MRLARTYRFGESQLTLRFGDITTSNAQVLVSSDDSYISMGGGVSAAILRVGGEAIAFDAAKKVPAAIGDIVVTSAGALSAQYVFHAITIGTNLDGLSSKIIVERATRRCMQLLDGLQLSSIAFPAIGAGVAGFSYEDVAACMAEVIADELSKRKKPIFATIFLFDRFRTMEEIDFIRFFEEFAARVPRIAGKGAVEIIEVQPLKPSVEIAAETEEDYRRRRLHNLRKILVDLEDQRSRLEERLIVLLDGSSTEEESRIRHALKENQELRLEYLTELRSYAAKAVEPSTPSAAPASLRVFVSSTSRDLAEHRRVVKDVIARCDYLFRGMEHFGADPSGLPPARMIVDAVRKADVYLGIFGVRYGSIDPATGLSMTELEFREAETAKKPMLLYIIGEKASVPVSDIESDPESQRKLTTLKEQMRSRYVCYMFQGTEDLGSQAYKDLKGLTA